MTEKFHDFDPAELLDSNDAIEAFLIEAMESGDAKTIAAALGVVARSKGMGSIAKKTGLAREQLYKSLSENGNPTLETTLAVMKAIGFHLAPKQGEAA